MTSYPRVILDWSLFYIELCYCHVPTFALWFDIWNHINPVSACYSVAWPVSIKLQKYHPECTQTRLFELKNQKIFWGGGTAPSPDPVGRGQPPHTLPPRRLRRLDAGTYGARNSRLRRSSSPAFPVSPPDLGVLAETLPCPHMKRQIEAGLPTRWLVVLLIGQVADAACTSYLFFWYFETPRANKCEKCK